MDDKARKKLRELAHNIIASELGIEDSDFDKKNFEEDLFHEKRGVFVTLEQQGKLRGCIGNIKPIYPLYEAVQRNAHNAAFGDPRFPKVTNEDFENIEIEISVLTKPKQLKFDSPEQLLEKIEAEKDGVVIKQNEWQATYLPQVWDDFPDKEEFLSSLCIKAGLEPNTWQDEEVEVFTYQVEKF